MVWFLLILKNNTKFILPAVIEDKIANVVNREFDKEESLDVVVSDLIYVNVRVNGTISA